MERGREEAPPRMALKLLPWALLTTATGLAPAVAWPCIRQDARPHASCELSHVNPSQSLEPSPVTSSYKSQENCPEVKELAPSLTAGWLR